MKNRVRRSSPAKRLERGAAVLNAAQAVDTRLVKERLERFERVQTQYVDAQQKVDAGESGLEAAKARLAASNDVQEKAVEALARALVTEGQARSNPFEAFGAPSPSVLLKAPGAPATKAVRQLVVKIEADRGVGKKTIEAARAAEKAAHAVDQALAAVKSAKAAVRGARRTQDAIGEEWESALAALKRLASAVAEEGAPDVYVKLFPPVARAAPKGKGEAGKGATEEAPVVTPTQTAA